MRRWSLLLALAFVPLLLASDVEGQEDRRPGELSLKTERVVIFKDGTCLVVKSAEGRAGEDGRVFTEQVPDAAVLGAFWGVPVEGRLRSMRAERVEVEEAAEVGPASSLLDLLSRYPGRMVRLVLGDGTEEYGALEAVHAAANIVEISRDGSSLMIGAGWIRSAGIEAVDDGVKWAPTRKVQKKRLTFEFEGAGDKSVRILTFRPGIRWIPTYRIELPEEPGADRARLVLQAEILNEAEDLVGVPLSLVVGVPHFRFGSVVSPFVLERQLVNLLEQAAPQLMGQQSMMSNSSFAYRSGERFTAPTTPVEIPPELVTADSQDLFVYPVDPIDLPLGSRAAVPLSVTDAPLSHVYTFGVTPTKSAVATQGKSASPLEISQQTVWHQIELTNQSASPWTTGAALLLTGDLPLGQELLTYTPAGARVRVPVTVAVDVRGSWQEEETGREPDSLTWARTVYMKLRRTGTVSVTNFKRTPVEVEITVGVGGHADEASEGGRIRIGPYRESDWQHLHGSPQVNSHSEVTFLVTVAPGETVSRNIDYHYFLRQ